MEFSRLGKLNRTDLEKILHENSAAQVLEKFDIEELRNFYEKDLVDILRTTKFANDRNVCAILLSDLCCVEAIDILVDLILDNSIKSKGSLIYALENLPIEFSDLERIFPSLYVENFECKMAMKSLIEKHLGLINDDNVISLLKSLQKTINSYEDSLELFCEMKELLLNSIIFPQK